MSTPFPTLRDIFSLSAKVVKKGTATGITIGTAESCTGGLLAAAITSIEGSSATFKGSAVTYSNTLKMKLLRVSEDTLKTHGAVSQDTALAMARGTIDVLGVDLAVSVTGIAGPGGGTPDKPVGSVWMGIAKRDGNQIFTESRLYEFGDIGRNKVRDISVFEALKLLDAYLTQT